MLVLLWVLAPVMTAGAATARSATSPDLYQELDLFAKALHFVRENYVETPDDQELLYGAIRGMMKSLDPYTTFMKPENYKELQLDTRGRFGGVGIEVTVRNNRLTVIAPIDGSPASRAGIRAGDEILKIDGTSTKNMTLGDAVKKMRGKRGQKIRLSLGREGRKSPLQIVLRRDIVKIQSVREIEELGEGLAYLRISAFQQDTTDALEAALNRLEKQESGLRGLIIDLRNNPGGLLSEAVTVSDKFLSEGVIVKTKSRSAPAQERYSQLDGTRAELPIVVLVNKGSASAAEIVAGALQDHGRAVLLGTTTFGKGSVQTVYEIGEGAAVKLTIARYYTPSGRSIHEKGIKPDIEVAIKTKAVEVPASDDEVEAELEGEAETVEVEVDEDLQKQKAIDYLRDWVAAGKKQSFRRYRG